jgi:hypothetical protein
MKWIVSQLCFLTAFLLVAPCAGAEVGLIQISNDLIVDTVDTRRVRRLIAGARRQQRVTRHRVPH